jgi:hypothetical protein
MKCQTCRCELTQAEADRGAELVADAGTICEECAVWLDIETRDEDSITVYPEGNDTAPLRLSFPRNPK